MRCRECGQSSRQQQTLEHSERLITRILKARVIIKEVENIFSTGSVLRARCTWINAVETSSSETQMARQALFPDYRCQKMVLRRKSANTQIPTFFRPRQKAPFFFCTAECAPSIPTYRPPSSQSANPPRYVTTAVPFLHFSVDLQMETKAHGCGGMPR